MKITALPPVPDVGVLPALRCSRGYVAAEALGKQHGVDVRVVRAIVRAAYDEIERATERVGHQCHCGALLANGEPCPVHGDVVAALGMPWARNASRLVVAFDPVTWG